MAIKLPEHNFERTSADAGSTDEDREINMKKMLAEIIIKGRLSEQRAYSVIGDGKEGSTAPSESRETTKSIVLEQNLGITKDSKSYTLVKKFTSNLKKRVKAVKMKKKVIEEMVHTERTYIKGLEWLIKWRNECLESKIASEIEVETLFSSVIDNIKLISDQILVEVTKAFDNWEKDSTIGDKFLNFAPFLKQYKDY